MSSRFVSAGTISASGETEAPADATASSATAQLSEAQKKTQAEWESVQADLEAQRAKREAERQRMASGQGDEGKSLYDVLQANKAAKQAAFEEATKLSNQFRSLDQDEVEFLDEVRQKKKAEEAGRQKEVEDGLRDFKEMQKRTAPAVEDESGVVEETDWAVGRKKRKTNKAAVVKKAGEPIKSKDADEEPKLAKTEPKEEKKEEKKPALGLVAYDSDDSDDEE